MSQQIKLLVPLFLDGESHPAGAVITIDMDRARRIVELGQAEHVVPHPRQAAAATSTPEKPATKPAGQDPHQQVSHAATSLPPTERGVTRAGTPDPRKPHGQ